jgi:ribonuclease P protein component
MISQAYRFHGLGSLRYVYSRGETVRSSQLSLKFVKNPRRKHYRAAVVVSRKVNKSAVVRNRIRRRLYAALRTRQDIIKEPYDLVFTVFSDKLATTDHAKLQNAVNELLAKAGIIF